uniref:Uncharacterized protein n=1 Tax=Rhizophora mucronata TaxID=61149 RepID=A0A2P2PET8_RHIMU
MMILPSNVLKTQNTRDPNQTNLNPT